MLNFKKNNVFFFFIVCFFLCGSQIFQARNNVNQVVLKGKLSSAEDDGFKRSTIDLSGSWRFQLDQKNVGLQEKWFGLTLVDLVKLPGTTDENKKGEKNIKVEISHLTRKYKYEGKAWYQRDIIIPNSWTNKHINLFLERTKTTEIWVDNISFSLNKILSSPHIYDLSKVLTPGKHVLTISVNNDLKQYDIGPSHALSEHTQTNWNGIIGRIELIASDKIYLKSVNIYPDVKNKKVKIISCIRNETGENIDGTLNFSANGFNGNKHQVKTQGFSFLSNTAEYIHIAEYKMGDKFQLWDEFHPNLYQLSVSLNVENKSGNYKDQIIESFGMVDFKTQGTQFLVNGKISFLRGKHDACVFPITGYPPMNTEEWVRILRIAKDYGINHYRFHSYSPPKAAFEAADIVGIYMQPELPLAKTLDKKNMNRFYFEKTEGESIFDTYANHPSFVMFSLGNELRGDVNAMAEMVTYLRNYNNGQILFAQGSNNFFTDPKVQQGDDFFVSARTKIEASNFVNDIRASFAFVNGIEGGYINGQFPNTQRNFISALKNCSVPSLGHETGQYQVLPNFDEISKYTGVVVASNYEVFKQRMKAKNMLSYWTALFMASGKHAAICYKEDNEMSFRTAGFGGFQILDLQDYPGQGTALVGMLDSFLDSKGLITSEEWKQSCEAQTIQAKMSKMVWKNSETFSAELIAINYGEHTIEKGIINWQLIGDNGVVFKEGNTKSTDFHQGIISSAGKIACDFSKINQSTHFKLKLSSANNSINNTYNIWVYPEIIKIEKPWEITIASVLNEDVLNQLKKGGKVLLLPDVTSIASNSVGGLFISDYWCYPMFRGISENNGKQVSPGTLGLLIDNKHPIFKNFPTNFHSDWQWWSIMKKSNPIILDGANAEFRPIVQAIDNFERCSKLGTMFEFSVGEGKLFVCSSDLSDTNDYVAQHLLKSIFEYMKSPDFLPKNTISSEGILSILYGDSSKEIKNKTSNEVNGYFFFD